MRPPSPPAAEPAAHAALRAAAATLVWSAAHSLLASHAAKRRAARVAGERTARGWYRVAYNAQAVATTAALGAYVWRHRGPVVYEAAGAARPLVRGAQAVAVAAFLRALYDGGIGDLSGLRPLAAWLRGGPLRRVPDGQGPVEDDAGRPAPRGLSFHTRNPANAFIVPVLWVAPRVRAGWAGMSAVFTAYSVVGSLHAERMMRARWGEAFAAYQRSGVPLLVPRLRPVRPARAHPGAGAPPAVPPPAAGPDAPAVAVAVAGPGVAAAARAR
jgi:hypothetical protein